MIDKKIIEIAHLKKQLKMPTMELVDIAEIIQKKREKQHIFARYLHYKELEKEREKTISYLQVQISSLNLQKTCVSTSIPIETSVSKV